MSVNSPTHFAPVETVILKRWDSLVRSLVINRKLLVKIFADTGKTCLTYWQPGSAPVKMI